MTDYFLKNYTLHGTEKIILPVHSAYSVRHAKASLSASHWKGRTVHFLLALIEILPILGAVISLCEKYLASKYTISQNKPVDLTNPNPLKKISNQRIIEIPPNNEAIKVNPLSAKIGKFITEVLSTQGFAKNDNDPQHELKYEQNLGEIQGHEELRKKIAEHSHEHPEILLPANLRYYKHINPTLFRSVQIKRLGHAFALSGNVELNGKKISLEGFNETFTRPMIASTFDEFAKKNPQLIPEKTRLFLNQVLFEASYHDKATKDEEVDLIFNRVMDQSYELPIMIGSGWDWHSTQVIFYKDYFFCCNRGDGREYTSAGVNISKQPREPLSRKTIEVLLRRLNYKKGQHCNTDRLNNFLCHPMSLQKVGNCTYASMKAAIFALLAIFKAEENPEGLKRAIAKQHETNFWWKIFLNKELNEAYKQFTLFDRELVLEDFLIDLEKFDNNFNPIKEGMSFIEMKNVIAQIQKKLLLKGTKKIIRKELRDKVIQECERICSQIK